MRQGVSRMQKTHHTRICDLVVAGHELAEEHLRLATGAAQLYTLRPTFHREVVDFVRD
jgi:hypothetical protein